MSAFLDKIKYLPWAMTGICSLVSLAAVGLILFIILVFLVYYNTTYRNPFRKRTRECSRKKDEIQMLMFNEGIAWSEKHKDITEPLHIINEGLNLYGEYINFGYDKCAVIMQGRGESLLYSYYFADIYANNGCNILVVDVRAHGLSDGKYQTGGIKESDDLILWIKHINEKFNIDNFIIHGICIGAATTIFAYSKLKKEGSSLIKMIITDGLYKNYLELYKAHARAFKVKIPPFYIYAAFFLIFIFAKVRPFKANPIDYMKDIDIPVLFIWSKMDKFCLKPDNEMLFEACASKQKEIHFFPKGRHSFTRVSQKPEYDEVITKFLQKYI